MASGVFNLKPCAVCKGYRRVTAILKEYVGGFPVRETATVIECRCARNANPPVLLPR